VLKYRRPVAGFVAIAAMSTLAACGSGTPSSVRGTIPPAPIPPATSSPTVAPTASPSTTASRCSNLSVIDRWPVSRRAAQLVVAPVLNFNLTSVKVASAAGVGGILFLGAGPPPSDLSDELRSSFAPGPPGSSPLVMADQEGGGVERLGDAVPSMPWPRVMTETMTPQEVQSLATRVGRSMLQLGVDVNLAPVLDVDAGPGPSAADADGLRSFSADPSTAALYGVSFMHGMQAAGVVPVVKHFPGLGGSSGNTDYGPATTPPLSTLQTAGLIPFRAAIAQGAPAVMVANASVPGLTGLPASLSPSAIDGLLRQDLGFQGLVLTDSLSAGAISQSGYSVPQAAVAAVSAGADMILFGSTISPAQTALLSPANVATTVNLIVAALVTATAKGTIPVARLNAAVSHVLAIKHVDLCGG